MNFHTEMESAETSKVFCLLGRKIVHVDRYTGGLRESHLSLNQFYGAFLPGFLWPIIFLCLVLSLHLVYIRILPYVHTQLLAKMDSSKEVYE